MEVLSPDKALRERRRRDVDYEGPAYELRGAPVVVTDEVVVQYRPGASREAIEALHERLGVKVARRKGYRAGLYIVRLRAGVGRDPLAVANRLHEADITAFAHPNYLTTKVPLDSPSDPYYPDQWHLENNGTNGAVADADVDAEGAWSITEGAPTVRIAVLDDGVEIAHEDLASQILDAYDFYDYDADPTAWRHGTCVAGVAAAAWDNGVGVSGMAAHCKLTAIRWGRTVEDDAEPGCRRHHQ